MTTKYCKDKILKLQQELDEKDDEIKRLNNELLLCKETKKTTKPQKKYPKNLTKGNSTITPMVKFESPDVGGILKGRIKAIKLYTEKKR